MSSNRLTRRQFVAASSAGIAAAALGSPAASAQEYGSAELIEAAKKEGKLVYYTADFTEVEQEIIKAFNKRFPFVKVEMVRAPGGQLITRIKTEAAANKLLADVVCHSDRGLMKGVADLFQDYRPPNADAYRDDVLVAPQLWPKTALGWSIAYNTELEKNPPKTWMDLCKPQYGPKKIGQVIAPSGGTTWTRIMFERQTFGDDYWKKQAATQPVLYPSGAPTSDALVRGEVSIAVLLYNIAYIKKRDGAPVDIIFPSDGVPLNFYAAGVTKSAAHPNAGKLFLNWCMSDEGQAFHIKELGYLTALKKPPFNPPGYDPEKIKTWAPN
ncbi:MAG TPA: extracellular solute-binding protein, partial [Hyphomicrobiaceae bacterium]|nr:extracellular solute-binding protein [Hyphomicrobiaceae bacterium]